MTQDNTELPRSIDLGEEVDFLAGPIATSHLPSASTHEADPCPDLSCGYRAESEQQSEIYRC